MRRLSRTEFRRGLAETLDALRGEIEASVDGFDADPAASAERRARAGGDARFFAETYFPHYRTVAGESAAHRWIYETLPQRLDRARGTRTALAAPRGEGKSTVVSLILALWALLTGRKRFVLLICDVSQQAETLLAALKAELEANPRLRADWPEACGEGRLWRDGQIVTRGDAMVLARGSGQRVRGLRHGPHRPDLVIGDDIESDESVRSLEQRRKTAKWWRAAVLNVGGPARDLDVVAVGTVIHHDCLLASLLASALWESAKFRAIVLWPDRMDLWDEFAAIARADGEEAALEYHAARREEMGAGAEVSWPEAQPLEELMLLRAEDEDAFATERQNDPAAGSDAIFRDSIRYWTERPAAMLTFGAVDPSLGRAGAGRDPSAMLVGGVDASTRDRPALHVLEASIRRRQPHEIIAAAVELQRRWDCRLWLVEAVQFQEYFRQELARQSALAGVPVPAAPTTPTTDKRLRIESIQPHMRNGLILLHRDQRTLIDQLTYFPNADHDDGPDALEMLWRAAAPYLGGRPPGEGLRSAARPDMPRIDWESY